MPPRRAGHRRLGARGLDGGRRRGQDQAERRPSRRLLAAWADEHDARCDRLRVDLLAITVDDAGECLVEHVEGLS